MVQEVSGRVGCAETGPRPAGQAPAGLDASRFDPAREWVAWTGGVCPVDTQTEIEYRLRWFADDAEPYRCKAGYCRWDHGRSPEAAADRSHGDGLSDIVAYRLAEQAA